MKDKCEKDYGVLGWVCAVIATMACLLWLVAMIIAPAALIKFCWAYLAM